MMVKLDMRPLSARLARAAALCAALAAAATPAGTRALAAETGWVAVQGAEVRLLGGPKAGDGKEVEAGIELRLAPGWKTYWRYPGDSGVPPVVDWQGSPNVAAVEMAWPAPRRFRDGAGGHSIGYKGDVVFPLKVRLADPAKPARLEVAFDFAVCEALCVPAHARLSLDLDGSTGAAGAVLAEARARLPAPAALAGPGTPAVLSATIDGAARPPVLVIDARTASPEADLFVEGPDEGWALPLPSRAPGPGGTLRFTLPLEGVPDGADPATARLTATLVDGGKAVEVPITVRGK